MEKLFQGAVTFRRHIFSAYRELFARLASGQRPEALFVTCSDSRIVPNLITATNPGDLFVVRNVGNIVPPPDTPSAEAAALEFAVGNLGVRDIIVCGHSGCGAVRARLQPPPGGLGTNLKSWLRHMDAAVDRLGEVTAERQLDQTMAERLTMLAQMNVLLQLQHVQTHPMVAERLSAGTLKLHGWYFEIERAELSAYDAEKGSFQPLVKEPAADLRSA